MTRNQITKARRSAAAATAKAEAAFRATLPEGTSPWGEDVWWANQENPAFQAWRKAEEEERALEIRIHHAAQAKAAVRAIRAAEAKAAKRRQPSWNIATGKFSF